MRGDAGRYECRQDTITPVQQFRRAAPALAPVSARQSNKAVGAGARPSSSRALVDRSRSTVRASQAMSIGEMSMASPLRTHGQLPAASRRAALNIFCAANFEFSVNQSRGTGSLTEEPRRPVVSGEQPGL